MKSRKPRCTTHFHACDCREAAHAEAIAKLEFERDRALGKHGCPQQDFVACGTACQMRDHETILGSVMRVVKERDEAREALDAANRAIRQLNTAAGCGEHPPELLAKVAKLARKHLPPA